MDFSKVSEKMRNGYYFFEDKWYDALDKIDTKVPVYKIVDPIDEVIPSFILFLLVILFIIILTGYLLQFSSPYTVVFRTFDSDTKSTLAAVDIDGTINDVFFELKTNSQGVAETDVKGVQKNIYAMLGQMLFGGAEQFSGIVNAEKSGYKRLRNVELASGTEHELFLEPASEDIIFLGVARVSLFDSETRNLIIDNTGDASVRYRCDNTQNADKTVRDSSDGAIDGIFTLNEPNCDFVLTYASAPGYERSEPHSRIQSSEIFPVYLRSAEIDTRGYARIFVYDQNDSPLDYIAVNFSGVSTPAYTDSTGVARKTLSPGTYTITIADQNYYSITPDDKKIIEIKAGDTTELKINLRWRSPLDTRKIFIKVVESQDKNIVSNASVDVYWLYKGDNNRLTNIDPSNGSVNSFESGSTDSNGLFSSNKYAQENTGKLVVVVRKEGYLPKEHFPELFFGSGGPEIVSIEKATSYNSGHGVVRVVAGDQNKPLVNASAYLSRDVQVGSEIINVVSLVIDTNLDGYSYFSPLATGRYFAGANYKNLFGKSGEKNINAGDTQLFIVQLNMDVANLKVTLVDHDTGATITSSSASVKSYTYDPATYEKTLFETLTPNPTYPGRYVSNKSYDISENYYLEASANGYISNYVIIEKSLVKGNNNFTIPLFEDIRADYNICDNCQNSCLYSPRETWVCLSIPDCPNNIGAVWNSSGTSLVCNDSCESGNWIQFDNELICYPSNWNYSPDGSIGVFHTGFYSSYTSANSSVEDIAMIEKDKEYVSSFKAVVYSEDLLSLYTMDRFDLAKITDIRSSSYLNDNKMNKRAYPCSTWGLDGAYIRDKNYYFPLTCPQNSGTNNIQAGFSWADNPLEPSTPEKAVYSFMNKFNVLGDTNDNVVISYRGMGEDVIGKSETGLVKKYIPIGSIFGNGLYLNVKLENSTFVFNITGSNPAEQRGMIDYGEEKNLEITLTNNTGQAVNGTLTAYSHTGFSDSFNLVGSGSLIFSNNSNSETLDNSLSINHTDSEYYKTTVKSTVLNSSNFLIIVLNDGNNIKKAVIDLSTLGESLNLSAKFISGVPTPTITGKVAPQISRDQSVNISSGIIKVDVNCDALNLNGTLNNNKLDGTFNLTSNDISGNDFAKLIDTDVIYRDGKDCAWITITPERGLKNYQQIIDRRVDAGPYGALDPSLACVYITSIDSEDSVSLDWNKEIEIVVDNKCSRGISFKVETELVCVNSNRNKNCNEQYELSEGEEIKFIIKGQNVSYDPNVFPNFTDILGLFPVYVKAKYIGAPVRTNFAVADSMLVNLRNDSQCFEISQVDFDMFIPNQKDFSITNHCQSTIIRDHFIPSTTISSFGYDITSGKPIDINSIIFNPRIVVTGTTYGTKPETKVNDVVFAGAVQAFGAIPPENIEAIPATRTNKYKDIVFNFGTNSLEQIDSNWSVTNIQIIIMDINSPNLPNGAKIDGDINLTYSNGNTRTISPRNNTEINPFRCTGRCEDMNDPTGGAAGVGLADLVSATFYLDLTPQEQGKIVSLKANFIGNQNTDVLNVHIKPRVRYTETMTVIDMGDPSENDAIIPLAQFSIPPSYTSESFIKSLDAFNTLSWAAFINRDNPRIRLDSGDERIFTWITGNSLKAKYVGLDYEGDNDTILNRTLVKNFGQGINYSLITVIDYVAEGIGGNRKISGVR